MGGVVVAEGEGCGKVEAEGYGMMGMEGTMVVELGTAIGWGKNCEPGSLKGNLSSSKRTCLLSRILPEVVRHL